MRALSTLLISVLVAIPAGSASAQPPPSAGSTVADVRSTLTAARAEIDAFLAAGGKNGASDHPAVKWHSTLWAYRERSPGTEAAAVATAEAIQLLLRADLRDQAHAKADSLGADDLAWVRLSEYLYYEASFWKDYAYLVNRLSDVSARTHDATVKSVALVALGRGYRRQGDMPLAVKTLELARAAAPESAAANEADGLLYDIAHLSLGMQAPAFSGTTPDGRTVTLDSLRGKAVAIVFWGST
jgi:hypothetical protein